MKINKYEEDKIDDNSKIAINDYNSKKISTNIFYYKIFLAICIFLNVGLLIFIFIYHNKIQEIEILTNKYSTQSKQKDELYNELQSSIDNKLTNLIAISERRNIFFSYSFLNKSEYDLVKNFIIEYHQNNTILNKELLKNDIKYKIKLLYQSASDYFSYVDLVNLLDLRKNALLIINTLEDEKFGIFLDEYILFDKYGKLVSEGKKLFLFSFKLKKMLKYIGEDSGLKIDDKSEFILTVGKNKIIINNYFYSFGGSINYPLNSFEKINGLENNFLNINGKFEIKNIEIFEVNFD